MPNLRLYTIGHGTRTVEGIVQQMQENGIEYVIDVRSIPYSKYQPEFSRKSLAHALRGAGLKYGFMGDQIGGRPKDPSCYSNGLVNYAKVRAMPFFKAGIARLRSACEQKHTVCLLCAEVDPAKCHRSGMIGEALVQHGVQVEHLLKDGSSKSQQIVMFKRSNWQLKIPFP